MKTLIIIPTYNEVNNIETLVKKIFNYTPNVYLLFIDDNSPDGTSQKINQLITTNNKIFLISRPQKIGLASAYLTGFDWAINNNYDAVIQMDADLSHPVESLNDIIKKLEIYDLVIGSRYVKNGIIDNWSFLRKTISLSGNFYAQLILNKKIKDWTGGFNGWRLSLLKKINLKNIQSNGYLFQIELKYYALRHQAKFLEIPIIFKERHQGQSKIEKKIIWEALWKVWKLKFCYKK